MDIIPPGIRAASRGLGIAMQYFQNACLTMFSTLYGTYFSF